MEKFQSSLEYSKELDLNDKLAYLRELFYHPENNPIYFCGHSLGLQPKVVFEYVKEVIDSWSSYGVEGHLSGNSPWFDYHKYLNSSMKNILGAKPSEIVIMNSLTTNLHLLMVSFFNPNKEKYNIIIDKPSFPSDKYAVQSQLKFHNLDPVANLIEIDTVENNVCMNNDDILYEIEKNMKNTAMILFNGVNYYSGQYYDIESIATLARKYDCYIGLDLAHATGNVKLDLNKWGIDFASWCGYKYLNGGPGAPSGIFVHEKHNNNNNLKRFEGWWGHSRETRFDPPDKFDPLLGAEAWQLSNPPILSLAALRSSLDLFDKVGIDLLIEKSSVLTGYLEFLIKELDNKNINIITPSNLESRGAQLSIHINSNISDIENYFRSKNIICDFRKPNVIRVAPNPFYNSYQDVYNFVQVLQKI